MKDEWHFISGLNMVDVARDITALIEKKYDTEWDRVQVVKLQSDAPGIFRAVRFRMLGDEE